uniref:Uncharacterized protein n=1 Tax=Aegilops tauschii subsp. strangulata TaxID=200361 RepID=A0A453B0D4_AEGTS
MDNDHTLEPATYKQRCLLFCKLDHQINYYRKKKLRTITLNYCRKGKSSLKLTTIIFTDVLLFRLIMNYYGKNKQLN